MVAAVPSPSGRMISASGRAIVPKRRGGKELLIAVGVILVLAVTAGVMYVSKTGKINEAKQHIEEQKAILDRNMKLARDRFTKAEMFGRLYCMDGSLELTDEKVKAEFGSDDRIYNVVYDRLYKSRQGRDQQDQRALSKERMSGVLTMTSPTEEKEDVRYNYGLAEESTTPVIIAFKFIKPKAGDTANSGGKITIIVRAEMDDIFKAKLGAKLKETGEKKAPAEKTEKKGP